MSIRITSARIVHGDAIVRNRVGSLPPPQRYNVLGWTSAAFFALGAFCGFLAGLAA